MSILDKLGQITGLVENVLPALSLISPKVAEITASSRYAEISEVYDVVKSIAQAARDGDIDPEDVRVISRQLIEIEKVAYFVGKVDFKEIDQFLDVILEVIAEAEDEKEEPKEEASEEQPTQEEEVSEVESTEES